MRKLIVALAMLCLQLPALAAPGVRVWEHQAPLDAVYQAVYRRRPAATVEEIGPGDEGVDGKEPAEGVAGKNPVGQGAVSRVDEWDQLLFKKRQEVRRSAAGGQSPCYWAGLRR